MKPTICENIKKCGYNKQIKLIDSDYWEGK